MSMYFDARRDHLRGSILKSSRLPAFMCHLFSIDAGSQELRCAPLLFCKPSPLELADPKRHGGTCLLACTKPQNDYISLIVARSFRDDRIDELERENIELRAKIREQQAVIETQQKTIAVLEQRIEQLEARLRGLEALLARNSGNSSCPPSSDPPGAPPPAPPKRTGRKRGGQPGHAKHSRHRVPPERVNRTIVVKPEVCRRCGDALHGDDPAPHRHQVLEVPKVMATVDEYQLLVLGCPKCGISTRASLPPGVAAGQFGPRLQAIVSVCSGAYRMSKRGIEELVEDFFDVPISLGSISNLEQATSEAVAAPVEEVARVIREQPVVHADETGWYERSKRAWLWAAVTSHMALFLIRASRGAHIAKELLGAAFAGILVSDRWSAYSWVDVARRQLCWAHLLRQFRGFQDHGQEANAIGRALELLTDTMFHAWHRVRDGTMTRAAFQEFIERLRLYVVGELQKGAACPTKVVAGRCREILELSPALWTFAYVEGVEPTNNAGEHRIRHGVLWRKTSFGTDSPSGSRFVERILTVVTTLRMQRRNVLDYVTDACEAVLQGRNAPSLLPG
jgi:transposase